MQKTELQRKIRVIRKIYNISQREIAIELGVVVSTVCNWEIGRPPSPLRFKQILIALKKIATQKNNLNGGSSDIKKVMTVPEPEKANRIIHLEKELARLKDLYGENDPTFQEVKFALEDRIRSLRQNP